MNKTYDNFMQFWKNEREKMTAEMLRLRKEGKTYAGNWQPVRYHKTTSLADYKKSSG